MLLVCRPDDADGQHAAQLESVQDSPARHHGNLDRQAPTLQSTFHCYLLY